jgi:hypothetical protein
VLESPHEVTTFQYNPLNPDIIVGGCCNGQVIMWDTSGTPAAAAAGSGGKGGAAAGGRGGSKAGARGSSAGVWEDDREGEPTTAVIRHK